MKKIFFLMIFTISVLFASIESKNELIIDFDDKIKLKDVNIACYAIVVNKFKNMNLRKESNETNSKLIFEIFNNRDVLENKNLLLTETTPIYYLKKGEVVEKIILTYFEVVTDYDKRELPDAEVKVLMTNVEITGEQAHYYGNLFKL